MASFRFVLRASKQRRDGSIPIYLRVTENRKSRFMTTGIAVEARHWNDDREEVRRSHELSVKYNDELSRQRTEAVAAALELKKMGKRPSAAAVKQEIRGKGGSHVLPFARALAEEELSQGKYYPHKKVKVLVTKLRDYHGSEALTFSDLDREFLTGFERYLRTELKNKTNTVAKDMQILKKVIKRAFQEGIMPAAGDPFLYYRVRTAPTTKDKLPWADIRKLEALVLPEGSPLELTRDAFLFSFYSAGIRFGDLCQLRWRNVEGGRLTYMMGKTGRPKSIKLPEPALVILKRYRPKAADEQRFVFPLLNRVAERHDEVEIRKAISSKNVVVNRNLKTLAAMIETRVHLSFHVSRHSFADHARTSGVDLYAVSKALGHSSLSVTQTYLNSFDHDAVDGALDRLFG